MAHLRLVFGLLTVSILLLAGGIPRAHAAEGPAAAHEELAAMNAERHAGGLPPLSLSAAVQAVATARAAAVAATGVLSHTTPAGQDAATLLAADGVWFDRFGENLGQSAGAVSDVRATLHTAWMGSPAHRANILDPGFRHVGIGFADDGVSVYAAVVFLD